GLINPQVVGLIQQYFLGPPRGRAFGLMGTTVGLFVAIGPVLGGSLIVLLGGEFGCRASFLVNVPFAIASLLLAKAWFPPGAWRGIAADEDEHRRDLDPVGVVLLGLGVLLVLLPFVESSVGWFIWLALPLGLFAICAWTKWERRYAARGRPPMVDLDLFGIRSFSSGSIIITLYYLSASC